MVDPQRRALRARVVVARDGGTSALHVAFVCRPLFVCVCRRARSDLFYDFPRLSLCSTARHDAAQPALSLQGAELTPLTAVNLTCQGSCGVLLGRRTFMKIHSIKGF